MTPDRTLPGLSRRDCLHRMAALACGSAALPALSTLSGCAATRDVANATDAQPATPLSGVLRLWGHGQRDGGPALPLVEAWARGFVQRHPGVRVTHRLRGDNTAIGGLYTGAADLALMIRPPLAIEVDGYKPLIGNEPFAVPVATGGVASAAHAPAVVACVHPDNPLRQLSLAQLDALLSADRRRGHAPITRWADLGVQGPCRDQPVRVLLPDLASDTAQWLQHAVMAGGQKWAGTLHEMGSLDDPTAAAAPTGRRLMQALRDDPCALAITTTAHTEAPLRALALSADAGAPAVAPTPYSVAQRRYPLVRTLFLYARRPAGQGLEPLAAAFLRHVLGASGQADVAHDGRYLPLPPEMAGHTLERLA